MLHEKLGKTPVIGPFIALPSPEVTELVGLAGYDFAIFDQEHGQITIDRLADLLRAAEVRGLGTIVRTSGSSRADILRPLDLGARGLIIPQVDSAEEARAIVYHARYAPGGGRGVAMPRASHFGAMSSDAYFSASNREVAIIVQAESQRALDNLESIAAIQGLTGIFLGPFDLSVSLGVPGQTQHPKVEQAAEQLLTVCKARDLVAGIFVTTMEEAIRRRDQGFGFVAFSMDTLILSAALKAHREKW